MINKKGYTLLEVLVCIAIVGIVAALTVPSLVNKTSKSTLGATLARTFELTQIGMTNIIQEANRNSEDGNSVVGLSAIQKKDIGLDGEDYIMDDDNYGNLLRGYFDIDEFEGYAPANIKDYTGADINEAISADLNAFRFKKLNSAVIFQKAQNLDNADRDTIVARVIIDANGVAAPNRFGEDVFLFGLTNSGTLIPAGSRQYFDFDNNVAVDACADTAGNGLACAARVMADKWEIKY